MLDTFHDDDTDSMWCVGTHDRDAALAVMRRFDEQSTESAPTAADCPRFEAVWLREIEARPQDFAAFEPADTTDPDAVPAIIWHRQEGHGTVFNSAADFLTHLDTPPR